MIKDEFVERLSAWDKALENARRVKERRAAQLATWRKEQAVWYKSYHLAGYAAYSTGLLHHNQEATFDPSQAVYNEALCHAIRQAFGSSVFKNIVSLTALESPADPVEYLKFSGDEEITLSIEKDYPPFLNILLKTRFPLSDLALTGQAKEDCVVDFGRKIELEIYHWVLNDIKSMIQMVSIFDFNDITDVTLKEKYEHLYVELTRIGVEVHKKTLRGGPNWIILNPKSNYFEGGHRAGFSPEPLFDIDRFLYYGQVNNRWRIFGNDVLPKDEFLLGYRGDSHMDSPIIYGSHIPFSWHIEGDEILTTFRVNKHVNENAAGFLAKIVMKNQP